MNGVFKSFRLPSPLARWLKRMMPRSLFGRTLLIIVAPTVLALCVATFVFFNRHWYTVTHRLTFAVAGDVAAVLELLQRTKDETAREEILEIARKKMEISASFVSGAEIERKKYAFPNPLREMLNRALKERIPPRYKRSIDMRHAPETVAIRIGADEGVYTFLFPERRIYTPTTEVFIGWMIGSSVLLSFIALMFMRNQVRPIRRLAAAAEAIGKGQEVPFFKPEGATEVRQAAAALQIMRERLRRQITQRTAMLAGVSHDLRTPLTRMKLQLELMPDSPEKHGLASDIAQMEAMVESYLAFARGEEVGPAASFEIGALLEEIVNAARRHSSDIGLQIQGRIEVMIRREAMKRCLDNLLSNALRYGRKANVSMAVRSNAVDIIIDDDGPGVAPDKREEVFRPFFRLEGSRNPETGGVGLGLTIARDVARFHGGDVVLEDSPMGGTRARVWIPL